jgi:hypothetical protein
MSTEHDEQQYQRMAESWQDEDVPQWNRMRHLVQPQRQSVPVWLQWGTLAASALTLVLTVSRTEIDMSNGLTVRFGGQDQNQLRQLVTTAVANANTTQSAVLDARLQQFAADQQQANRALYVSWQEANRRERRQELGTLVSGWRDQRLEDQQAIASRFTELTNDQLESNQYLNNLMQTVATRPGRRDL